MQISQRTIAILKSFDHINPKGIVFTPGNVIRVRDEGKDPSIIAFAETDDTFENSFAIYNISQFISVLSSFENPTLNFKEKYLFISQDKREVQYTYGNPDLIQTPGLEEALMPPTITDFTLTDTDLNKLTRISNVLQFPDIAIVGEKGKLYLRGLDVKNPTNNLYNHQMEGNVDRDFKIVIPTAKIDMLMDVTYMVTAANGIIRFRGADTTYWIAPTEKDSEY